MKNMTPFSTPTTSGFEPRVVPADLRAQFADALSDAPSR